MNKKCKSLEHKIYEKDDIDKKLLNNEYKKFNENLFNTYSKEEQLEQVKKRIVESLQQIIGETIGLNLNLVNKFLLKNNGSYIEKNQQTKLKNKNAKRILIVTHGAWIKVMLTTIFDINKPSNEVKNNYLQHKNCGYSVLEYDLDNNNFELISFCLSPEMIK